MPPWHPEKTEIQVDASRLHYSQHEYRVPQLKQKYQVRKIHRKLHEQRGRRTIDLSIWYPSVSGGRSSSGKERLCTGSRKKMFYRDSWSRGGAHGDRVWAVFSSDSLVVSARPGRSRNTGGSAGSSGKLGWHLNFDARVEKSPSGPSPSVNRYRPNNCRRKSQVSGSLPVNLPQLSRGANFSGSVPKCKQCITPAAERKWG